MSSSSFKQIYAGEQSLAPNMNKDKQYSAFSLRQTIGQISDIATAGLTKVLFSENYNSNPLLEKNPILETVAAHTEITVALFERALIEKYGEDFGEPDAKVKRTEDGYSYREAMEAARIYSLPQIQGEKGDAEEEKTLYYGKYAGGYGRGAIFAQNVIKLTSFIDKPETATEKMLYLADRTAYIFMELTKERRNDPSTISRGHSKLTEKERQALVRLPAHTGSNVKLSQFLLYKYFKLDKLTLLDDTGFFTAVIIAHSLNIIGFWPSWREDDYN